MDRPVNVRGPLIVAVLCTLVTFLGPAAWIPLAVLVGLFTWCLTAYRVLVRRDRRRSSGNPAS